MDPAEERASREAYFARQAPAPIDYAAVLADLRKKRAALDQAIVAVEQMLPPSKTPLSNIVRVLVCPVTMEMLKRTDPH